MCVHGCPIHTHAYHTHLTDQTFEGQTILQHQAITHYPPLPKSPLLYISPFSNLWLLYVKYIYVCIYTVYMYW